MKEYYQGQQQAMNKLDQAEQLLNANQWKDASQILNSIS
jgi:hypothetical protein